MAALINLLTIFIKNNFIKNTISGSNDAIAVNECLKDVDGQILTNVVVGQQQPDITLRFDLGAVLCLRPSAGPEEDQWSLQPIDGDIITCHTDGMLSFEPVSASLNA